MTHKYNGLKTTSGLTKDNSFYGSHTDLFYNIADNEVWGVWHPNSQEYSVATDGSIGVGKATEPMTMAEIAKMVDRAYSEYRETQRQLREIERQEEA